MKKKGRDSRLTSASDVLQNLLDTSKSPLSDQFLRWKLWKSWPEIVGPDISKNTLPVGFTKGTLWVWVKDSVWYQELIFITDALKLRINESLETPAVTYLRFTLDRKSVPQHAEASDDFHKGFSKSSD